MTANPLPDGQLDALLFNRYGSYLRTVRYHSRFDHLCPICGGIKSGNYNYCISCTNLGLPDNASTDRIALGFYAVEESQQFYKVMHDYKEPATTSTLLSRNADRALLSLILRVQVSGRLDCLANLAGSPVTAWAVIPSSKQSKRAGKPHPLAAIVRQVLSDIPEVVLVATGQKTRTINPNEFSVSQPVKASLDHVLLIDDSWVTGGSIQSAALTLKNAGARQVSAYCIARIVQQGFAVRELGEKLMHQFYRELSYQRSWCPWHRRCH